MNSHRGPLAWKISRAKILTREEVAKILKAAKASSLRDYLFLAIAANVGIRLCEIIHIKRKDVGDGQLDVTRRKRSELLPETVDISDDLGKLVSQHLKAKQVKSDWIFPGHAGPCILRGKKICDGGHVSRRDVQRRWEGYLDQLGLAAKGRGIHSLRHYAVTEFYSTHKDIRATQMFAGHSTSTITEVYSHVLDMKEKIRKVKATL